MLIKHGWKDRKTSCAAKDGPIVSETCKQSFIYAQTTKLGKAVRGAICKPSVVTRREGGKPAEVVLLEYLGGVLHRQWVF